MNKLSLEGVWKLRPEFLDVDATQWQRVLNKAQGKLEIYHVLPPNVFPARQGAIEAQVPCDVITPLVEHGLLEEPLEKTATKDCLWIKDLSWWFIKEFTVSKALLAHEEVRLFIEMLDYKADIILNGIPVDKHANAFVPYYKNVKDLLVEGENTLIIRLTSGTEDFYDKDSIAYYGGSVNAIHDNRIYLRKPQFTYGWDWCQPVPTCGIGRSIYLEGVSGSKITHFRADTLEVSEKHAQLELYFEIENLRLYSADDTLLEYEISLDGKTVKKATEELYLVGGLNFITLPLALENPALWWPNGYGAQAQYEIKASVTCRGAKTTMASKRFGVRTIKIVQDKRPDGTREFYFAVNGVKVWCKGGNWVPTDSVYLRTPAQSYKTLVDEAKAANFTMLRMWGGGTYEPDCFYEYCSENGILLMHDFMYSCAFYPDHLDWFLQEASKEADYQTKRLAHYACMAVWTGNNEIHESVTDWFTPETMPERLYGGKIFNYVQPEAVRKNSPLIPYMPSSPFYGDNANSVAAGDSHVWKPMGEEGVRMQSQFEFEAFDRLTTRFSSEYGFFGAQMLSTIERFHAGEPVEYKGEIWNHHGEFDRKRGHIDGGIQNHFAEVSTLDMHEYLLYSGLMHGSLYYEMTQALRHKPYCSGQLIWMYNDCWPETGWTIIDYYLTRKISFYFLKRGFSPQHLMMRVVDDEAVVTVINETPEAFLLSLEYGYISFTGETKEVKTLEVAVDPRSWQQPISVPVTQDLTKGMYYVKSSHAGFAPAHSMKAYYRDFVFPEAEYTVIKEEQVGNTWEIAIKAVTFIPCLYLACQDDRTHLNDNYVSLLPGQEITFVAETTEKPEIKIALMMPKK